MTVYEDFKRSGMTLVGLCGRKGSGKSTFAKCLAREFPFHVNLAFADPVRSVALAIFGSEYRSHAEKDATDAFWQERLGDEWGTGRAILQRLGTEVFRNNVSPNIWLHCMERRLMALTAKIDHNHPRPLVTIDDLRFQNELEMVKNLGGHVIKLVNPNSPPNVDGHSSEAGLPDDMVDSIYTVSTEAEVEKIARAWAWCFLGR